MKKRRIHIVITALLVSIFFLPPRAKAAEWQQPMPGIFYTKLRIERPEQDAYLDVFRIDPAKYAIKPLVSSSPKTAQQFAAESKALMTVNANFFDEKGKPLGFVLDGQKTLSAFKNISWWSVFCLKNRKPSIVHVTQANELSCDAAIQAGPRLVIDGTIPKFKEALSYRTAIGINQKQEIVLAVSHDPLFLKEMAQIFSRPEADGGLDCRNALNLDGGPSSQVYATLGDVRVGFGGFTGVPVVLGVFSR